MKRYVPEGLVYPPIDDLRETSVRVTASVIAQAIADGVATAPGVPETDIEDYVRAQFWRPRYLPFVRAPSDRAPRHRAHPERACRLRGTAEDRRIGVPL